MAAARASAPAPAGTRLLAFAIDAVFVVFVQAVMLAPVAWYWWTREAPRGPGDVPFLPIFASVTLVPLAALVGVLYHVYFWTTKGATPGKELLDLRVEEEDGRSPVGLVRRGAARARLPARVREPRHRLRDGAVRRGARCTTASPARAW